MYRRDIVTEVELMHERGRFSSLPRSRTWRPAQERLSAENTPTSSCDDSFLDLNDDAHLPSDQHLVDDTDEIEDESPDPVLSHECECVEHCLLSDSFFGSVFDADKFSFLSQAIVLDNNAFKDKSKMETVKSRVVTSLARKMSSSLVLSRSQNDQLLRFWKAMITFISPESANIARRIFGSYSSCVRQTSRAELCKKELCQEYMEKCLYFSIGIDTALFRAEHVMSCFIRFCFDDGLVQVPLFFATCYGSTGNNMAAFVFFKLLENNARFEKLVAITTDGAKNMTGRDNGMVAILKRTKHNHCQARGINSFPIQTVWCFAHRINLVAKDFLTLKGVDFVKSFCEWFTWKRRQINNKRFLALKFPDMKFQVVPQPSDTRWHFFKDVIAVILSQQEQIDEFVKTDPEFRAFWNASRCTDQQLLAVQDGDLFFRSGVINTRFQFVHVVIELLGKVITYFQGIKYEIDPFS